MNDAIKSQVIGATILLPKFGGRGFLVTGNFILTAAHCIEFPRNESLALGDNAIQPAITAGGCKLRLGIVTVDLVADIAVLGPLDVQDFPKDFERFEQFCDAVTPLRVFTGCMMTDALLPVHIFTHKRAWLNGTASVYGEDDRHMAFVRAKIRPGTSGSAIVTDKGEIVAIASVGFGREDGNMCPRPNLALPVWICRQMGVRQRPNRK